MAQINFTKTHEEQMDKLALKMLKENRVIPYGVGQIFSVIDLLHTVSINTLNNIRTALAKKIEQQESKDEWVDPDNGKLNQLKEDKELVNLIVGWKRKNMEIAENKQKKAELTKKLTELKESTKTPEDRIKEMEAALAELEEF